MNEYNAGIPAMMGIPNPGLRLLRIGICSTLIALSGCVGGRYESDFPIIVVNRTANSTPALATARAAGTTAAAAPPQPTSRRLEDSHSNVFHTGTAPTPQADVTFTAPATGTA